MKVTHLIEECFQNPLSKKEYSIFYKFEIILNTEDLSLLFHLHIMSILLL